MLGKIIRKIKMSFKKQLRKTKSTKTEPKVDWVDLLENQIPTNSKINTGTSMLASLLLMIQFLDYKSGQYKEPDIKSVQLIIHRVLALKNTPQNVILYDDVHNIVKEELSIPSATEVVLTETSEAISTTDMITTTISNIERATEFATSDVSTVKSVSDVSPKTLNSWVKEANSIIYGNGVCCLLCDNDSIEDIRVNNQELLKICTNHNCDSVCDQVKVLHQCDTCNCIETDLDEPSVEHGCRCGIGNYKVMIAYDISEGNECYCEGKGKNRCELIQTNLTLGYNWDCTIVHGANFHKRKSVIRFHMALVEKLKELYPPPDSPTDSSTDSSTDSPKKPESYSVRVFNSRRLMHGIKIFV